MRHVTDGELHAFLDGGLDLLPEDRGREVREHLSECPVCQERLQDEEALRARASEILGDPGLGDISLPSYEDLREVAEAPLPDGPPPVQEDGSPVRYRGPLRGIPLAWAATIVLALGVGWMGGQVWENRPAGHGAQDFTSPYEPIVLPDVQRAELGAGTERLQEAEAGPGRERLQEAEAGSAGSGEVGKSAETAQGRPTEAPGMGDDVEGGVPEVVAVAAPEGLQADSAPSFVAAEAPSASMQRMVVRAREAEEIPGGPGSLENSLAVPGLKVVSIEWEERVEGEKALLIRQLLSPGDTLELRYIGMLLGVASEAQAVSQNRPRMDDVARGRMYANVLEASLPPGWHQVVMEKGRSLLVARAPIPERNLKALLKSLQ